MKAAVVRSFGEPLVIEERPEPGPGQVRIRLEASGLCHTDIHAAHGDWPVKPTPPFVPGHEGVGIVEALGDGVTRPAVGQRVAVPWPGWACGRREHCLSGTETLCEQQGNTGYSVDGGYAGKILDLRHRPERHLRHRLHRGHPPGPGRGLPAACRRTHRGHP
ncbi:hypothetical protein GCM10010104_47880 [Streptomyces indiaensis]|uniref:alcohol dehydrogenase n=1 Tax=Streptomyces indiaensis TaxID=284033 RepID=A0ABN3E1F8_9ACTN